MYQEWGQSAKVQNSDARLGEIDWNCRVKDSRNQFKDANFDDDATRANDQRAAAFRVRVAWFLVIFPIGFILATLVAVLAFFRLK